MKYTIAIPEKRVEIVDVVEVEDIFYDDMTITQEATPCK